jgi:hypothetical protein
MTIFVTLSINFVAPMGYKLSAVTGPESLLPSYTFEVQRVTDHSLITWIASRIGLIFACNYPRVNGEK